MFENYIKTTIRNIKKYKGYAIINILGLAIGMACFVSILLWVQTELNWDNIYDNSNNIFKLIEKRHFTSGEVKHMDRVQFVLSEKLESDFPEIENATRFRKRPWQIRYNDKAFQENGAYVDRSFLDMFRLPFSIGNSTTGLTDNNSIVISEKTAAKIFGDKNPIGKTISARAWSHDLGNYVITGVFKNVPQNSHIQFDWLTLFPQRYSAIEGWGSHNYQAFVQLKSNTDINKLNTKLVDIIKTNTDTKNTDLYLIPISKIHLSKDIWSEAQGNMETVFVFSILACFILLIACINFLNLSTAQNGNRSSEIGVRKVNGAGKIDIIYQFLSEAMFFSIIALILAIILVKLFLPLISDLAGIELTFDFLSNISVIFTLICLALVVGFISGSYPALYLSKLKPIRLLRSGIQRGTSRNYLRKTLVIVQFTISVFLIIGTLVVLNQVNYMKNLGMGIKKENIIIMFLNAEANRNFNTIKSELLRNPKIKSATLSNTVLGYRETTTTGLDWDGKSHNEIVQMNVLGVDYDFMKTFELKMDSGRYFSEAFPGDENESFIVNQEAVKVMGIQDPVGKRFKHNEKEGIIIGVIKDFHYTSFHENIQPLIMELNYDIDTINISMRPENTQGTIEYIERTFKQLAPGDPFNYYFLNDLLNRLYVSEQQIGNQLKFFATLAILISCLGLLGLITLTVEMRKKEIGIRKINGASVVNIVFVFLKDSLKWITLGNVFAWPLAYYFSKLWLENYPFRTDLSIGVFIASGVFVLFISIITISYHAIKAALVNPIETLRCE